MHGVEAEILVTSLSFTSRPSVELLRSAKELLQLNGQIGRKAYLAVSSLVNNYCHLNERCHEESIVQDIIRSAATYQ